MSDERGRGGARTARVLAPLLLTVLVAVALARLAFNATRDQREAARRTVGDFANFAAFIVGNAAQQELERRLLYAFGGVRGWDGTAGTPLPDVRSLAQDNSDLLRCAASGAGEPTFARLDLRDHTLTFAGAPPPEEAARWLADTLAVEAASYRPGWSFAHVLGARHGMPVVAYTVLRDRTGEMAAVYAKTSCLEIGGVSIFERALASTTPLPPSLTGELPADSLITLVARDPDGGIVHRSPHPWASAVSGSTGPLPQLGNLELRVELRRGAESRLVVGGIPYGGRPMAGLLLLLLLVSGGLAVLQVRRQNELMRTRERFISNVSHELRTPLQQILVFTELLHMERLESPAERRHSLGVVEREARRLIQLVENVLAYSSRGNRRLMREPVQIEPLARETITAFEPLARTSPATVRLVVAAAATARGDGDAIRRTLLNLLDNAVKYGPAGQTVTVTIGESNGVATIAVDDEGPGIPPEDRRRIWSAFSRLDHAENAATAGSGIGLSIVRDLVERMEGTISVSDAPGGGARFLVSLPAAR